MSYSAKILADSISPNHCRLVTFEITFPRIVLAEFNTHRVFSRNSASSRAIPTKRMIEMVRTNPFIPARFPKVGKGMQPEFWITPEDNPDEYRYEVDKWLELRDKVADHAQEAFDRGLGKQIINRPLETFMWHTTIVSATEFNNFFKLRCHPDAQLEIRTIAEMIQDLYRTKQPVRKQAGQWHLPLIYREDEELAFKYTSTLEDALGLLVKISTVRSAKVSYMRQNTVALSPEDFEKDLTLHDKLSDSGHWCYDEHTEVLTDLGWKFWKDLNKTEKLVSVNIDTKDIKFENPSQWYESDYNGVLYYIEGSQLDLAVTPNHKMVVSQRKNGGTWTDYNFQSADKVFNRSYRYLKAGNLQTVKIFENKFNFDSNVFSKLAGFFIGDGYASGNNQITFHLKRQRKIDYLSSLGIEIKKLQNNVYCINIDGIGNYFRELFYNENKEKTFPLEFFNFSYDEVIGFFDGLKNSDGSIKRNTWIYDTTSSELKDRIQALSHLNGMTASVSVYNYDNPNHNTRYRINFSSRIYPRVEILHQGRSNTYKNFFKHYTGKVYCATVSTGALLIRRNNKVVVSGNSPFEHAAVAFEFTDKRHAWMGNFRGWKQYRKFFEFESGENIYSI